MIKDVVSAIESKIASDPTPEIISAYIKLIEVAGKDGDYAATLKRIDALEKRLTFVEGTANIKRLSIQEQRGQGVRLA